MATAPIERPTVDHDSQSQSGKRRTRRRRTSHLKLVPETRELRDSLRARCEQTAAGLDKSRPTTKDEMEAVAQSLLGDAEMPEGYLGWTMVGLASAFWRDQVAAVPYERRLFLLPHCLKHAEGCPADYDDFGLDCRQCGACSIADFRTAAEDLGYKVLVAEGSPIVLKIIVSGHVDAIVGVACLNVLERAIDKILLAGIPCVAVPLLSSDCRNTSVDEDWVREAIDLRSEPIRQHTRTYVHLMRAASGMFADDQLERLSPCLRGGQLSAEGGKSGLVGTDPVAATEAIAYDFLARGGKHSRPFITLAVHDALTDGRGTLADGAKYLEELPDEVKRAALSIETFHKASLVHDDIEDDDRFRYGEETLHRRYGTPTAINVGDYLIGLGYRLVSRERARLGAEVAADILDRLAESHMKLCEGQGAELVWRDSSDKQLGPIDALKIYALKTAPAFEAAFYAGARLADSAGEYQEPIGRFARNLGVAFQILNDLGDWNGDDHNKLVAGGDVLGGRPTILWALALEGLDDTDKEELLRLVADAHVTERSLSRVRQLYRQADVFEKAARLVDKYQQRAEAVADDVEPEELRRLLYYLVDTVLERPAEDTPQVLTPSLPVTALPAQSPPA